MYSLVGETVTTDEDLNPRILSSLFTGQGGTRATYGPTPGPSMGRRRQDPQYPAPTSLDTPGRGDRTSPTGGSRGTKTDTWSTTQAWCFPLKEATWKPVAPMLKARTNHASAALNGEVYAIGGKASLSAGPGQPPARCSPLAPSGSLSVPQQWLPTPRPSPGTREPPPPPASGTAEACSPIPALRSPPSG